MRFIASLTARMGRGRRRGGGGFFQKIMTSARGAFSAVGGVGGLCCRFCAVGRFGFVKLFPSHGAAARAVFAASCPPTTPVGALRRLLAAPPRGSEGAKRRIFVRFGAENVANRADFSRNRGLGCAETGRAVGVRGLACADRSHASARGRPGWGRGGRPRSVGGVARCRRCDGRFRAPRRGFASPVPWRAASTQNGPGAWCFPGRRCGCVFRSGLSGSSRGGVRDDGGRGRGGRGGSRRPCGGRDGGTDGILRRTGSLSCRTDGSRRSNRCSGRRNGRTCSPYTDIPSWAGRCRRLRPRAGPPCRGRGRRPWQMSAVSSCVALFGWMRKMNRPVMRRCRMGQR